MAELTRIGGNKILLRDGDTKIFFDFGMSFASKKKFYSPPFLSPKSEKSLQELGILPKLEVSTSLIERTLILTQFLFLTAIWIILLISPS
jgi:hypothetical protein